MSDLDAGENPSRITSRLPACAFRHLDGSLVPSTASKASWSFWEIAPPPKGVQLRGAAADAATALTDAKRACRAMGYDDELPVEYHEGMSPRGPADRMPPTETL